MTESISSISNTYGNRFKVNPRYFNSKPPHSLSLVIAIPSYKEPDIVRTLESLSQCTAPNGSVEIIIGINAPDNAGSEVTEANHQTALQIERWKASAPAHLKIMVIREESIPHKWAGAGYARKLIMDEALHRWAELDRDGPIVCLDADCTVSENYLTELENSFSNPEIRLGHLYFEHPYQHESDAVLREGIINYELHLRCYIRGLKMANYPYAVHTVGSCMAVRASTYAKGGGMNKRKAGEDFHFLHKLVQEGGWQTINKAVVYPSCRASDRVPFGTGKAQLEYTITLSQTSYNPEIYKILGDLFKVIDQYYNQQIDLKLFPKEARDFLRQNGLENEMYEMKRQSGSLPSFRKRWWQWMDGLKVLKLVHHLRDQGLANVPVVSAAQALLLMEKAKLSDEPEWLLNEFRNLDRNA